MGRAAMSKKQVLLLSFVVALPAIGLLVTLVFGALEDGGNMFSGMMTAVVAICGLLVLALGLSPFAIMAFYPAEGFASLAPPPQTDSAPSTPGRPGVSDEDDDEFEDDDGGFESDDGFDDDYEDSGEELYDDGDDEFEDFDDDEDWA